MVGDQGMTTKTVLEEMELEKEMAKWSWKL